MEQESDDVSNIHDRFSLTLVNPGSKYFSLVGSLVVGIVIVLATCFGYLNLEFNEFWYKIPMVLAVMAAMQLLDIKFAKKKEYSKSLHSSLFGNMLMGGYNSNGNTSKCSAIKRHITVFHYIWNDTFCKF